MKRSLILTLAAMSASLWLVGTACAQIPTNGPSALAGPSALNGPSTLGGPLANPDIGQVLGRGRFGCEHVIDLLLRNSHRRSHRVAGLAVFPEDAVLGAVVPGDLVLLDVHLVAPATPECGPVYQVRLRNDGQTAVQRFQVSLVAVLGVIRADSPCVTVGVPCLKPNEIGSLRIKLPIEALGMAQIGGQPAPFNRLIVAIDSFDEWVESNELNNVAILPRTEIAVIQVVQEVPAAPLPQQPAPDAQTLPDRGQLPTPAPVDPISPPDEQIDLDKLDLDEVEQSAMRLER